MGDVEGCAQKWGVDTTYYLLSTPRKLYIVKEDWKSELYLGISIDWDYNNITVVLSMLNYIEQALIKYISGTTIYKKQDSPHKHQPLSYRASI